MKTMEINDKTYFLKNNKDLFIATLSEFAHKSFEVASLNDIIKTSGLNKGSFYYRFNDKLDLYYALMDYLYIEQLNIFEKQTQYLKGNFSLEVLLHAFFTNSYNLYSLNPELLMLNYNSFLEKEDLKNNRLEHCISSLVDKVLPVIENLILKDYKMKSTILKMFIKNVEIQYYFLPFVFKDTFTSSDVSSLVSTLIQSINLYRNLDNLDQSVFLNNKMSLQLSKENKDMFDLNLKLTKGEILAIVGPNKSPELILQKLILELFDINDGEIEYLNKESLKMKDFHKELGYSFEKPYLFEKKTVYQNLTYYSKLYQKSLNIDSFLKSVNYSKFRNTPIKNLSNSSKIFVNILRSMISEPKLMIFDNLFEDMFLDERELIFDFLLKNARNRSTIVLLDRHMFFPLKIADRITFVVNNEIHKITSTATLKSKYQNQQVTITYEKNNSLYEECFSKSIFREDTFLQFLKEVSIQEITTKNIIDDELYKLETGVDLNE